MGMRTGAKPTNEINVTPLIDVLLVLLVIFLAVIPITVRIQPVELPRKDPDRHPYEPPVVVKLHGDLTISIDDGPPVPSHELPSIRTRALRASVVFVDAEAALPWDEVVSLVDRIKNLESTPGSIDIAVRIHDPIES